MEIQCKLLLPIDLPTATILGAQCANSMQDRRQPIPLKICWAPQGDAGRKFDARYKTDTHSDPFARLVRKFDAGMEMTTICWMVVRDTYPLDPENVALGSCNLGQYVKMNCWPYLVGRCISRVPGDQRNNRVQSLCKEESANMYAESTTS